MSAVKQDPNILQQHMSSTYTNLRIGIGSIGAALPLLLWPGGLLVHEQELRHSMSDYYYSLPLRDIFVGALVTLGVFLYLYKGFSKRENYALNIAGLCAIGVAMFPTTPQGGTPSLTSKVHGTCAVILFLCIAYVSIFRSTDTLKLLKDENKIRQLRRTYKTLGIGMAVSPLVAVVLTFGPGMGQSFVFFVEAVAVWAFAAYWLTKSYELAKTDAEQLVLAGKVRSVTDAVGHLEVTGG